MKNFDSGESFLPGFDQGSERKETPQSNFAERVICQYCEDVGPCQYCERGKMEASKLKLSRK